MEAGEFFRVVRLRRGKMTAAEFRVRDKEKGLSLFAHVKEPGPARVLEAVHAAGKQGELAVAVIRMQEFRTLGLVLVKTPGGTPSPEVNAIHFEARFPFWRRVLLRLRGLPWHEYFNLRVSPELCAGARLLD
jgi:hypothetical protein